MTPEEAAQVLADLDPIEVRTLLLQQRTAKAREIDDAKPHPMRDYRLSADDWAILKAYILDGGGVDEDSALATDILQAVFSDDQETFWDQLMHLVKARAKINGRMRPLPFGGVSFTGIGEVGPAPVIDAVPQASGEGNDGTTAV